MDEEITEKITLEARLALQEMVVPLAQELQIIRALLSADQCRFNDAIAFLTILRDKANNTQIGAVAAVLGITIEDFDGRKEPAPVDASNLSGDEGALPG